MRTYLCLLAALLLSACSSTKDEIPEVPEVPDVPAVTPTETPDYESSVVNPDYVNIDWETTKLQSAAPELGYYSFSKNDVTENLHIGNVLTIDMDSTAYIVVVNGVNMGSDGNVYINTLEGDLCDIFANVEFSLSTADDDSYTKTSIDKHVLDWKKDYAEDFPTLYKKGHISVNLDKAEVKFGLDFLASFNFSGRTEKQLLDNGYYRYRSKMLKASASLKGTFNTDFEFSFVTSSENADDKKEEADDDGPKLLKSKILVLGPLEFVVYGVPIEINLKADLYKETSLEMGGDVTASTTISTHSELEIGAAYNKNTGTATPIVSLNTELDPITPKITGRGSIVGSASIFPRISVMVYNVLGPVIDIKPLIGMEINGGFDTAQQYIAWNSRCYFGVETGASLVLNFVGIQNKLYETSPYRKEWTIYKSPVDIQFHDSMEDIQRGKASEVKVDVYDSLFNQKVLTPFPIFVKYEGEGEVSSPFGIANQGTSSVYWTPQANESYLKASLLDADGDEIANVTKNVQFEEEPDPGESTEEEKRLSSIDNYFTMSYDSEGRLSRLKLDFGDDEDTKWQFSYSPFMMTDKSSEDRVEFSSFHMNSQGNVSGFSIGGDEPGDAKVAYTDEGYLKSVKITYDDGCYSNSYYEWKDGNLVQISSVDYAPASLYEESITDKYVCDFEYGDIENTHSLPTLLQTMACGAVNALEYTGVFGKTISKNLLTSITETYYYNDESPEYESYDADYQIDDKGYILCEKIDIEGYTFDFYYHYKTLNTTKATVDIRTYSKALPLKRIKHHMPILWRGL